MGTIYKDHAKKLETHLEFTQCKADYASLKLLKIIWEFVYRSDDHQYSIRPRIRPKECSTT